MTRTTRRPVLFLLTLLLSLGVLPVSAADAAGAAGTVTVSRDVTYGTAEGVALKADTYWPATWAPGRPAVVLVHGGAWLGGDKAVYASLGTKLAERGIVAVSVNYRLQSAKLFPAEVNDVQTAIRLIRTNARYWGIDPDRIGVLGDSAGGNLATLAGMAGSGATNVGARVKSVVSMSGVYDLSALGRVLAGGPHGWIVDAMQKYLGCLWSSLDPACIGAYWVASPINHVDPTDPPVLLLDSADEGIPVAQADLMALRLRLAGVHVEETTYPGTAHGTALEPVATDRILDFFARTL